MVSEYFRMALQELGLPWEVGTRQTPHRRSDGGFAFTGSIAGGWKEKKKKQHVAVNQAPRDTRIANSKSSSHSAGTVCGFGFLCTFKLAHFGLTWILNSLGSTEDLFQTFCGAVMTSVGNWVRCLLAALRSVCGVRRPHRHLPEEWDSGVVNWQERRGFGMHLGKEVRIEVWKTVQEQPLGRLRAHYVEWEKYSVCHRPKLRVFLHRSTYKLKLGGKSENWVLEADFDKIFLLVEKKYKAASGYFEGKGSEKYGLCFFLLLESLYSLITERPYPQVLETWHLSFPVVQHGSEKQNQLSSYSWEYTLGYGSSGYYSGFFLLFLFCSCRWNR